MMKKDKADSDNSKAKSGKKLQGAQPSESSVQQNQEEKTKVPVVGIGSSAGGLDALSKFFKSMPSDSGVAFVVVQHLDPTHESMMADLLTRHTDMEVVQVEDGMEVEPDHVYVIAPNTYLVLEEDTLKVGEPLKVRGMRMPIDYFFRSLGKARENRAICIVLSGTATDGTLGLRAVKSYEGLGVAQDPQTASHEGMPRSAISTGLVDLILPVEEMPEAIINYVQHPFIREAEKAAVPEKAKDEFQGILALLRHRTGHDFRLYKKATLVRRIQRRIGLNHLDTYSQYLDYLREHSQEVDQLFRELLINVTDWFRDSEAWEKLKEEVLPQLFKQQRKSGHPLRIWVVGCATGEEAYSLAMLLTEVSDKLEMDPNFLIFATDVSRESQEVARNGVYPDAIADDIPKERLDRFFIKEGQSFKVKKTLRETIVFAQQNVIADPPFSRIDLITCRNLLIYLEPEVQKKIISLFHFSLSPDGFLFLGNSEGIAQQKNLFKPVSQKRKIFRKVGLARSNVKLPASMDKERYAAADFTQSSQPANRMSRLTDTARDILLDRFVPAAVVIDNSFQVLYFHGPHENYLLQPPGEPTTDLLKIAREGLQPRLRGAVHAALKKKEEVGFTDSRIKRGDRYHRVKVTVTPFQDNIGSDEELLLVTFEDIRKPEDVELAENEYSEAEDSAVRQLEEELKITKEELQSTIEELETSNEELQSSNEEVTSMNEELQTSNEELETSKEELQSMNEELTTVNAQLEEKIKELENANNDLYNLLTSTDIATIFLDKELRIKRYTPAVKKIFNYIPSDLGRPISDLDHHSLDPDLHQSCQQVLNHLQPDQKEVRSPEGCWYIRRTLPYRTEDDRIDGVVITFTDVDQIKKAEMRVQEAGNLADAINEISEVIHSTLDFNAIMERVTAKAAGPIGMEAFSIGLLEDQHYTFRYVHQMPAGFNELRLPVSELKGVRLALRTKDVITFEEAANDKRLSGELIEKYHIRSVMIAPLVVRGEAVGTLNFYCLSGPVKFGDLQTDYARKLADSVSLALANARLVVDLRQAEHTAQENKELAEHRLAELQSIYDSAPVGLCYLDTELKFIKVNDRLAAMNEVPEDEHLGRSLREVIPDEAEEIEPYYRKVLETGKPVLDVEHQDCRHSKTRDICYWLASFYPVRGNEGSLLGVNAVFQDVTQQKLMEQDLKRSNQELEQFAYIASHDLQTPLQSIAGFLSLLSKRYKGKLDEEADKYIAHAVEGAQRMHQLINDILSFSRLETNGKALRPTSMEKVFSETLLHLQEDIEETGAVIEHDRLPEVRGDAGQLVLLLQNLVGNAIKYRRDGVQPNIRIAAEKENGRWRFQVSDNGVGFEQEHAESVFEVFKRLHAYSEYPGTGIGLAICKKIVERHGGEIRAESEPGRGTTFFFTLLDGKES